MESFAKMRRFQPRSHNSFTLIEMLTVMAIIAILAALTLSAVVAARQSAARGRAHSEIAAYAQALENYKADNGSYPISDGSQLLTNSYATAPTTNTSYITNATILYQALTGKTNYTDTTGGKSYVNLSSSQVGNTSGTAMAYIIDPWGYAYGYSTGSAFGSGTPSYPYNGQNSFDLWSTGGDTTGLTNKWISNFQQ